MKKILDDTNYVKEREKKSICSVSTLYTWELNYALAFSVLLQASMGLDVIICVCGCESAFLLILKASIKGLVWLKGFHVCSSTLAFQISFLKHWIRLSSLPLHCPTVFHLKTFGFPINPRRIVYFLLVDRPWCLNLQHVNAMKGGIWQCFTALNIPPKATQQL